MGEEKYLEMMAEKKREQRERKKANEEAKKAAGGTSPFETDLVFLSSFLVLTLIAFLHQEHQDLCISTARIG